MGGVNVAHPTHPLAPLAHPPAPAPQVRTFSSSFVSSRQGPHLQQAEPTRGECFSTNINRGVSSTLPEAGV